MPDLFSQPDWATALGTWVGFTVALFIFSGIFGDHWLARLGQHILIGSALGYAAAVTLRAILDLPLVQGLRAAPLTQPWDWVPIVLALLLVLQIALVVLDGLRRSILPLMLVS